MGWRQSIDFIYSKAESTVKLYNSNRVIAWLLY